MALISEVWDITSNAFVHPNQNKNIFENVTSRSLLTLADRKCTALGQFLDTDWPTCAKTNILLEWENEICIITIRHKHEWCSHTFACWHVRLLRKWQKHCLFFFTWTKFNLELWNFQIATNLPNILLPAARLTFTSTLIWWLLIGGWVLITTIAGHCRPQSLHKPKSNLSCNQIFLFLFSFAICYWYWLHRCVREEFWGHWLHSGDKAVWDQESRSHLCLISHHCRESKKWEDTSGASGDLIGLCGCGGGGWGRGSRREEGSSLPVLGGALRRRPQTVASPPSRVSPWTTSCAEEREREWEDEEEEDEELRGSEVSQAAAGEQSQLKCL